MIFCKYHGYSYYICYSSQVHLMYHILILQYELITSTI